MTANTKRFCLTRSASSLAAMAQVAMNCLVALPMMPATSIDEAWPVSISPISDKNLLQRLSFPRLTSSILLAPPDPPPCPSTALITLSIMSHSQVTFWSLTFTTTQESSDHGPRRDDTSHEPLGTLISLHCTGIDLATPSHCIVWGTVLLGQKTVLLPMKPRSQTRVTFMGGEETTSSSALLFCSVMRILDEAAPEAKARARGPAFVALLPGAAPPPERKQPMPKRVTEVSMVLLSVLSCGPSSAMEIPMLQSLS